MDKRPPVVVHPPSDDGGRRVTIEDEQVGTAYSFFDVLDLVHGAGLPGEDRAVDDPDLIEWRGGGPYDWSDGGRKDAEDTGTDDSADGDRTPEDDG
ncbi:MULTISPECIES: hypothetical protein [unclassified Streptomyces]|uniref:hypothetical protein n=1 Tax=unclassified Streptomyces TaxID=2593676 RepID=UPI001F04F948|nr:MULTISPECIES: hypothetical protein [unclassified Streptomyces]MCH0562434.1 hypothetical protein [Streptomyces sp. MUM 2J]MCH0570410.1 hypothetical protein [Streptomyces sp. MUM 136J]